MLLIFADCGLRLSELATIRVSDADLPKATLVITGKGQKQRQVPLSQQTVDAIRKQVSNFAEIGYTGPWLFPGVAPGSHYSIRGIDEYFSRVSRRLGIKVTPHQLRHYFATHTLSHGASIKAISAILGHVDTSTTADIYWHILDQQEITDQHAKYSPLKGALCQE
jgi:integrase